MDSGKTVTSIRLNNDSTVFLVLEWEKDKKLNLQILNIEEKKAYEGQATEANLRSQAAKIRMSFSDFMLKTRDALFKNSPDQNNYLYSIDKTNENYVFKWKSIDSEETIISLGSLEMEKTNFYRFLTQFLFSFTDEMQSLKSCIESLNSELNTCKSQLSTALTNLSSAIGLKKSMEKELYSKFILLLNEKKCRIKELEKNQNVSSPITKKKKMPPTKMLASSDESYTESANNSNTSSRFKELEKNHNVSSPMTKKKKMPPTKMLAFSDESDTELGNNLSTSSRLNPPANSVASYESKELEKNHKVSSPMTKKKKMPPTKMLAFSDESDTELGNNLSTSSRLNPPANSVASYESNPKLDSISNTSSQLYKKKTNNHFLNMLVSSSESDVDGEFLNEDAGPSNQRLNNSLLFDDEPKMVPQTQIRKRKVGPQKDSLPNPSHPGDKDSISDASIDSLMELL